jgi:hypothetical protein
MREVDLRLSSWRGLEAQLKGGGFARTDAAQEVLYRSVAALIAELAVSRSSLLPVSSG